MNAIEVREVSKRFRIPHERHTTIAERLLGLFRPNTVETLEALSEVTLTVPCGSFVGIIGSNGSGKSTLLKIMAGLLVPDRGEVRVHGTVVPLLELGLGFQLQLSVRENVELYGAVLGYSRATMASRVDEVVAFAGLERFQDAKLKTLSSGMMVRLAFATALRADADTLLLDEVMAVGDAQFQRKCVDVFVNLKRQRKTIVLVSHDLSAVQRFCDHVFWLDKGRLVMSGEAAEVIQTYLAVSQTLGSEVRAVESRDDSEHRFGDGQLRFTRVRMTDERGEPVTQIQPWTRVVAHADVIAHAPVENPVFGVVIWLGAQLVYSTNSHLLAMDTGAFAAGERRHIEVHFTSALANGRYSMSLAATHADGTVYDWVNHAASFLVAGTRCGDGIADLGAELVCDPGAGAETAAVPTGERSPV
jgi:lipopolysaccharide transport system ATP-binding protein